MAAAAMKAHRVGVTEICGAGVAPGAFAGPYNDRLEADPRGTNWSVICPDGAGCSLRAPVHTVTEHEDGTISVSPSIIHPTTGWHGFLQRGTWREV